jgi:signal transduction histidine kinase
MLASDRSTCRALVIEDDADTRANLQDILELDDWWVEAASTAQEVLHRTDWSDISVVILDRKLPDGNAEQLLPEIRRRAPQAAVIVVTGYADLNDAILALRHGAVDYLIKPINPDALRASVSRILEQKQMEVALHETQQKVVQSERLAAIGQMMAGLAHESRNALQRSKACLEMLALEVEDRPSALDLVARIQRAQDHLTMLYEEVRQYAAPINLNRESCDLSESWRETWADLAHLHTLKNIRLCEHYGEIDLCCQIDRFAMGQVWRNILENAIHVAAEGGQITVHCAELAINGRAAVRIGIADEGPGMTADQRKRIFEPFFTTKTKGTGLGMAIAQRIVSSHGGTIGVADRDPPGAEIIVVLPRDVE